MSLVADAESVSGPAWYAVHTQPRGELLAERNLERQGYGTFLPRYRTQRRHARRVSQVVAPFFSRYLFVRLDLSLQPWRPINGTRGVTRLVMCRERPVPVQAGVVETLIDSADADGCLRFDPQGNLQIGQTVEVMSGPFARHFAVIERLDDNGRVRVLLELMESRIPVTLPLSSVQ